MPAAQNKTELLDRNARDFARLETLLNSVPPAARNWPDPENEGTTIKDIVGHRAHWIDLFLHWQSEGAAGRKPDIPAPGTKWSDLRRYNADL